MGNFFGTGSNYNDTENANEENFEIVLTKDAIDYAVDSLAEEINDDYADTKGLVLVCVLKGAVPFMIDLSRKITVPHEHRYITAKSYLDTESTGDVQIISNEPLNIYDKDVIIINDIINTGLTLNTLVKKIREEENPKSLECCVLLNKSSKRKYDVDVKYYGVTIDDEFVIGYGLDCNEKYRNLPYIAIMEPTTLTSSSDDGDDSKDGDYIPDPNEKSDSE